MSPGWEDINARVHGLARHFVPTAAMGQLADAADLTAFARAASAAGVFAPETGTRSVLELELALRRVAAAQFRIVLRWLHGREPLLHVVIEDEDRRSIRAIVRGTVAAASADERLAGLVPTPNLPERLLEELARQPRPEDVARLLAAWRHPFGPAVLDAARGAHPDLLRFELALDRTYATRAAAGAGRGDATLRGFVAQSVDLMNVTAALMLAGGESEIPPESAFLPGGRRLTRERFLNAVASGPARVADRLAEAFPDEEAAIIRRNAHDLPGLEHAILALRISHLTRQARLEPLGSATVLGYFLRLRAQSINLRLLLWGAAVGAPPTLRRERLLGAA